MYDERDLMLAYLYARDRQEAAARARLVREAHMHGHEGNAFAVWCGRKLVRIGQRLEAFGAAEAWEQAKVA